MCARLSDGERHTRRLSVCTTVGFALHVRHTDLQHVRIWRSAQLSAAPPDMCIPHARSGREFEPLTRPAPRHRQVGLGQRRYGHQVHEDAAKDGPDVRGAAVRVERALQLALAVVVRSVARRPAVVLEFAGRRVSK